MELTFTLTEGLYVATQEVNDDYNVHVECAEFSDVVIYQKTAGTKYAEVHAFAGRKVVDDDFDGIVYPKTIKVTATVQPTSGIITEVS